MKNLFLFPLIVFALIACSKTPKETAQVTGVNEQPNMPIVLTDSSTHNAKDFTGKNILVLFQPDCDHCQREAADFEQNLDAFKSYTLYFITAAPMQEIKEFSEQYKLDGQSNVHFGFTQAKNILDNFGPISAPSIYIYSEDHKLVKKFNGEVKISEVEGYL